MQDKPIGAGEGECGEAAAEYLHDQAIVLTQVLALYPAHLTISELVREITAAAFDVEPDDRYERAIGDLCGAGLLNLAAGLVLPTRAALHFRLS